MSITLDGLTRPKAATAQSLSLDVTEGTTTEYDAVGDGREGFFIPFNINITASPFDVSNCTVTNGADSITTTNNGFTAVKIGDEVSGTGIPASTTVIAKTDDDTIQISGNATADGLENLTFTPNGGSAIDATLFGLGLDLVKNGSKITLKVTSYAYDGSLEGTLGTDSNQTSSVELGQANIDLDSFLTNARVPRVN